MNYGVSLVIFFYCLFSQVEKSCPLPACIGVKTIDLCTRIREQTVTALINNLINRDPDSTCCDVRDNQSTFPSALPTTKNLPIIFNDLNLGMVNLL